MHIIRTTHDITINVNLSCAEDSHSSRDPRVRADSPTRLLMTAA